MTNQARKPRHYLIACGTSHYMNLDDEQQLDQVPKEIETIVHLFTSRFGYERVLEHLGINPKAEDIKREFADWLLSAEVGAGDCVIFYYSGHGESVPGDKHYLWMKDTVPTKLPQTALTTDELVRPLNND